MVNQLALEIEAMGEGGLATSSKCIALYALAEWDKLRLEKKDAKKLGLLVSGQIGEVEQLTPGDIFRLVHAFKLGRPRAELMNKIEAGLLKHLNSFDLRSLSYFAFRFEQKKCGS